MGVFSHKIAVGNPSGGDFYDVEAMVDTGATYSQIPSNTLHTLHIAPMAEVTFRLADDSEVVHPVSEAYIRIDDAIRTCVVVFGPSKSCLLGATALENFGLAADPVKGELVPTQARL